MDPWTRKHLQQMTDVPAQDYSLSDGGLPPTGAAPVAPYVPMPDHYDDGLRSVSRTAHSLGLGILASPFAGAAGLAARGMRGGALGLMGAPVAGAAVGGVGDALGAPRYEFRVYDGRSKFDGSEHHPDARPVMDTGGSEERIGRGLPLAGEQGPEMRAYNPSWVDRAGAWIAGDNRDPIRQRLAEYLVGSRGLGSTGGLSVGDVTGANNIANSAEAVANERYAEGAGYGLLGAVEMSGLGGLTKAARGLGGPLLEYAPKVGREGPFYHKIKDKSDAVTGDISGIVKGNEAFITYAQNNNKNPFANSTKDVLHAARSIQDEFPHVTNIRAARISGVNPRRDFNLKVRPRANDDDFLNQILSGPGSGSLMTLRR